QTGLAMLVAEAFGLEHGLGVLENSTLIMVHPFDGALVSADALADLHFGLEFGSLELFLSLLRHGPGGSNCCPIAVPQRDRQRDRKADRVKFRRRGDGVLRAGIVCPVNSDVQIWNAVGLFLKRP